eukprot:TRINITY_DN19873_c0_g2_i1.p1 TRINITY_DN19873_c0_g2~~TRINITY_DN19873_c0_g2_i1.p1  ORF type:complete len:479 (+),score=59.34 TRINITY_DN19873_c0_g2_i1:41-1477(+)
MAERCFCYMRTFVFITFVFHCPRFAVACADGEFNVDFYSNGELESNGLVGSRCVQHLDFAWGSKGPSELSKAHDVESFSFRAVGLARFSEGMCAFSAEYADGIRVVLDGNVIIESWTKCCDDAATRLLPVTAGDHALVVEYRSRLSNSKASIKWRCISSDAQENARNRNCGDNMYRVEMFATDDLASKSLVAAQCVREVRYDWGPRMPMDLKPLGKDDHFSMRATKVLKLPSASRCTFTVDFDDGARVFVDERQVLDRWKRCCGMASSETILLAAGEHVLVAEFHEAAGNAKAKFDHACVAEDDVSRAAALRCSQNMFAINFFANENLDEIGLLGARCSQEVAFNWLQRAPQELRSRHNQISMRAFGNISFQEGWCVFSAQYGSGARVKVDGRKIIDEWSSGPDQWDSDQVYVTEGNHAIVAEFHDHEGSSPAVLQWFCTTIRESYVQGHRQYRIDMKLFYLEAPEHKINWVKPRGDL